MSSFEESIPPPRLEDQVTSVVNSESNGPRRRESVSDDHVVAQDIVGSNAPNGESERRPLADVNHMAHADQQERANVMARGGAREAILRARERHRQRNAILTRDGETPTFQAQSSTEQDDEVSSTTPVAADDAPEQLPEETPPPPLQDRVLDTRLRHSSPETIDPFRRSYNDPAPPVPASELPAGAEALSSRDGERTRFDSVPEIQPDIVLPRRQPPVSPARRRAEAARQRIRAQETVAPGEPASEPNSAANRPYDRVAGAAKTDNRTSRSSSQIQTGKPGKTDQSRTIRAAAKAARDNRPNPQVSRLRFQRTTEANDSIGETPTAHFVDDAATRDHDLTADGRRATFPDGADDASIRSAMRGEPIEPDAPQLPSIEEVAPTEPSYDVSGRRAPKAFGMFDIEDDGGVDNTPPNLGDDLFNEPVTVRRRSWLTGLGRRRQSGSGHHAPPAATFPLRAAAPSRADSGDEGNRAALPMDPPLDGPTPRSESVPDTVHANGPDRAGQHVTVVENDVIETQSARQLPPSRSNEARGEPPPLPASQAQRLPKVLPTLADETPVTTGHAGPEPARVRPASSPPRDELNPGHRPPREDLASPSVDTGDMAYLRQRLFGPSDSNGQSRASAAGEPPAAPLPEQEPDIPSTSTPSGAYSVSRSREEEYPRVAAAPGFDLRSIVARQHDLLDMRVKLAPEVPRICRTCRSFRPSENEERGWCTSEYAFNHRRMVNAGDRPCESTIGCWWLPNDEVWLPDDALKAFEEPTPLMDSILNRYERRRVGER